MRDEDDGAWTIACVGQPAGATGVSGVPLSPLGVVEARASLLPPIVIFARQRAVFPRGWRRLGGGAAGRRRGGRMRGGRCGRGLVAARDETAADGWGRAGCGRAVCWMAATWASRRAARSRRHGWSHEWRRVPCGDCALSVARQTESGFGLESEKEPRGGPTVGGLTLPHGGGLGVGTPWPRNASDRRAEPALG